MIKALRYLSGIHDDLFMAAGLMILFTIGIGLLVFVTVITFAIHPIVGIVTALVFCRLTFLD